MIAYEIVCWWDGCDLSAAVAAIHRTSPRGPGRPFEGLCSEHYREAGYPKAPPDPAELFCGNCGQPKPCPTLMECVDELVRERRARRDSDA